jgi:hypothetical protein
VFPGYAFEHGASKTDGERFCLASYIRPKLAQAAFPNASYEEPSLPNVQDLATYHGLALPEVISRNIWGTDNGL